LRTGIKYCHIHRSLGRGIKAIEIEKEKAEIRKEKTRLLFGMIVFTIFAFIINNYYEKGLHIFWVYFWTILILIILSLFVIKKKNQNNIKQ